MLLTLLDVDLRIERERAMYKMVSERLAHQKLLLLMG